MNGQKKPDYRGGISNKLWTSRISKSQRNEKMQDVLQEYWAIGLVREGANMVMEVGLSSRCHHAGNEAHE